MEKKIKDEFKKRFNSDGTLYASSGRINLIGEHTDYNGGFVFPGAVDKCIMLAIEPNGTDIVNVYALDLGEEASFGLEEKDLPTQHWADYIFRCVPRNHLAWWRGERIQCCFCR